MSYSIDWLIPERVVMFRFSHKLSLQESDFLNEALGKMIEAGQAPVHIIAELGEGASIPADISFLSRKSALSSEKFGYLVVVGANSLVRFIAKMVTTIVKAKVQMADSLDLAYQNLCRIDTSLPDAYE